VKLSPVLAAVLLTPALTAADYQSWAGAGFENARVREVEQREIYPKGSASFSSRLALTLILFDKTNWTEARALRQLRKAAAILKPCEIELEGVRLARVRGPGGRHDLDFTAKYEGSDMPADVVEWSSLAPPTAPWPLVFFLGRMEGDPALARSYRRGDVEVAELPQFPYMNTAWIAFRAHWQERKDEGYSSLAHELGHILCECGHVAGDELHLLNPHRNRLASRVLPSHCERMRMSPLIKNFGPKQEAVESLQSVDK